LAVVATGSGVDAATSQPNTCAMLSNANGSPPSRATTYLHGCHSVATLAMSHAGLASVATLSAVAGRLDGSRAPSSTMYSAHPTRGAGPDDTNETGGSAI